MDLTTLALLLVVLGVLVGRAVLRERRDYARFRRLRTTAARVRVYRRWTIEQVVILGGLAAATVLATWRDADAVLDAARGLPSVAGAVGWFATSTGTGFAIGAGVAAIVGGLLPALLLRREGMDEIPAVGDIRPLLPRVRAELPYGAALATGAGVIEELLFRLAVPALVFRLVPDPLVAFGAAALVFGLLHLYQGAIGVAFSTVLGVVFTALYVLSGSIWLPIVTHALLDLRSLVLIPIAVGGAWRTEPPRTPRRSTPAAPPSPGAGDGGEGSATRGSAGDGPVPG